MMTTGTPVSYTHLDVYKRQVCALIFGHKIVYDVFLEISLEVHHIIRNIKHCCHSSGVLHCLSLIHILYDSIADTMNDDTAPNDGVNFEKFLRELM